ncbi:putative tRNA dihydrouridine synthase [Apodospora peruviana]|uniref:tRNA dihydrouridine synthase n=1 Tax=Apodospora peruviana TaxID=516989 RepID=A0AAE0ME75_9PEZI|nr:putative tRNA dihydrouridine synthase [Apodospora peruviana]
MAAACSISNVGNGITTAATTKRVPIPPRGVDYRGKVVLAPMVRSGELPARLLALHYGADLVWGPETVDRSMIGTTRRVNPHTKMVEFFRMPSNSNLQHNVRAGCEPVESIIYRLDPIREAGRLIFQIGTSDPDLAVQAARIIAPDVAGIDVNAGCPKPFSTHDGMGAALLKTPDKLTAILEALVREIPPNFGIGVSVKIRLLETAAETEALVRRLVATGITGLTVHCRTTPMRPRERAIRGQLRMVADVCREAGVACVMNGDVEGRDHALELMPEFGVDGAMIATCAEKNSSCFRREEDGGMAPWQEAVAKYVRFAMEVRNKIGNTKYTLTMMVPGKAAEYKALAPKKSYTGVVEALGLSDDEEMRKMARETDEMLRIGEFKPPPPVKPPKVAKNAQQNQQKKARSPSPLRVGGNAGNKKRKAPPSPGPTTTVIREMVTTDGVLVVKASPQAVAETI